MATPDSWKAKVIQLTQKLVEAKAEFSEILNDWESVSDAVNNAGKESVGKCFRDLHNAKSELCALRGGTRRTKRKQRRTLRHRR
jgi:hypothetical protein